MIAHIHFFVMDAFHHMYKCVVLYRYSGHKSLLKLLLADRL
ncbi:unnamed protein product [Schistosoma mattheei]|uniref:Uncharacterized protein n=1 Tax=Schistosoma mattheei TaxID=31246 RepID=A0A183NPV1_9TREM|nr:unnamed protein product [Schistosoma mattheei]